MTGNTPRSDSGEIVGRNFLESAMLKRELCPRGGRDAPTIPSTLTAEDIAARRAPPWRPTP